MTSHWPELQVPLLNHESSVPCPNSFCLAGFSQAFPAWTDSTNVTLLHTDEMICLMPPTVKTNAEFQPRQQVPGPP